MLMDHRQKRPYTLNEIDDMDVYFYWKLQRHEDDKQDLENTKAADEMGI